MHGRWPYVPGEFDDYIATPKGNGYRSIHTAVIGPQARSVEVQIRTREMHEHAELGVAAHWTYKEGGPRDAQYQRKIEWVRRLLEPAGRHAQRRGRGSRSASKACARELFEDRVYVLTPKGEVIDLPRGATPLDFAYSVHTSLGHRCRGAKVNGRIVPLTHALANGEIVEIITGKQDAPSRDWLAPEQGYLVSARNRGKVRAWFRKPGRRRQPQRRRAHRRARARAHRRAPGAARARSPQELKARDIDHLHQLLGEGEITRDAADARGDAAVRAATGTAASTAPADSAPRRVAGRDRRASAICRSRWRAAARRCGRSRSPATSRSAAA